MRILPVLLGSLGIMALPATAVYGQDGVHPWVGASASALSANSTLPFVSASRTGIVFRGEGGLQWRILRLRVAYGEGLLKGDSPTIPKRRQVQGSAALGVEILPGLEVGGGLESRAYVTDSQTEHWVFWQLHGKYEGPVVASAVRGFAEAWGGRDTQSPAVLRNEGFGGAAGIVVRLAGALAMRVGYTIDQARLNDRTRRETVEGVTLGLEYGRR